MATRSNPRLSIVEMTPGVVAPRRTRRATDSARDPVSIVVADVYAAARAGVRAAVEPYGFVLVAEAGDAAAAVAAAVRERPRLCLLAADLPGGGLDATRTIARKLPGTAIVVLGDGASDEDLVAAVEAGASGYVSRTAAPARLPDALNAALDEYVSLPLPLLTRVVQRAERSGSGEIALPGMPAVHLTPREQQVLKLLLDGASTAEIAAGLGVSRVTVRRYTSDILHKAGVADRAALRALWDGTESS